MSSDEYFDDSGPLDYSAFIAEVDAIEAAHTQPQPPVRHAPSKTSVATSSGASKPPPPPKARERPPPPIAGSSKPREVIDVDAEDSFDGFFGDIDAVELEQIDIATKAALDQDINGFIPGSSRLTTTGLTRQRTLTGEILTGPPPKPSRPSNKPPPSKGTQTYLPFGGSKLRKVRKWDHTAFAKSGWKSTKSSKGKGKAKGDDEEGDGDESPVEFEQYPTPAYGTGKLPPFKHKVDRFAAQRWIYPTNKPLRDYQFNIAKAALFENTLVALPTGLGKTFIAGVLMYNYYQWFPEGKVIFVAPTKPLVAQQIDACHKSCGIPGDDAAELTGQINRTIRAQAWMEKHIFFMTPQTLMNDLKTGNCNPTDITLLVVDEAHKATGDYAYAQIVRYLMATNGHFRILALTATPGAKPEAVQAIVDSLHISHIEIRDENSHDLRQYILPKKISTHIVKMSPEVVKFRDMTAKLMAKIGKRLNETGVAGHMDYAKMHPYRCSALMQQFGADGTGRRHPWVFPVLKKLGSLARAMAYLLECSMSMFYAEMQNLLVGTGQETKKPAEFRSEPLFQELIQELERVHNTKGDFPLHPKMDKLQTLAVDYFAQANADFEETTAANPDIDPPGKSKMMVFTNYRSSVDEIVEILNKHQPLIRATRFIGQGTDKNGKKGIAQKEQLEVIKQFKNDVYNVLVATSIGEEGLDIGEVDMIVCYDAQKTPIRMLQRVGRTGRKRAGRVEVLLSESREEANWDKAKDDYESVQASIIRGDSIELYGDVDRLLPGDITPTLKQMELPIYEYVRETKPAKASTSAPKGTKRKRNDNYTRNIPQGAIDGFISSSKLIAKSKKAKTVHKDPDSDDGGDEEADAEPPRPPAAKGKGKAKANTTTKPKKTTAVPKLRAKKKKTANLEREISLSQLDREMQDDSDDMELERGIKLSPRREPGDLPSDGDARSSTVSLSPYFARPTKGRKNALSPIQEGRPPEKGDHAWLLDNGSEEEVCSISSDEDVKMIDEHLTSPVPKKPKFCFSSSPPQSPPFRMSPLSHVPSQRAEQHHPPAVQEATAEAPVEPLSLADSNSSVGPIRRIRKRQILVSPTQFAAVGQVSSPLPSPKKGYRKKSRQRVDPSLVKDYLDVEAEVSGEEGGPDSDVNDVESESDRRFAGNFMPTQAPAGYNQTNAYRHSLMTQAPAAPQFASRPGRRGRFGPSRPPRNIAVSSSPASNATPDQYSIDSFVVEDDDDILMRQETDSSVI